VLALLVTCLALATPAYADPGRRHHHQQQHVTACSRGLVALTFDDGPSATVTPRLVRLLQRLEVPATFFMVGSRITTAPDAGRTVERAGFPIGNHTWIHSDITTLTPRQLRKSLLDTRRAMLDAGLTPTRLMRPPYGAIDDDARKVLARAGYLPVLWTIDSRDWTGLTPDQIAHRVLDGVRPHETNIVLQHDGVTNSPATVKAVPTEVAALRKRGFCFAALDENGDPAPPVPVASITQAPSRIFEGERAALTVRLDRPTSRPTSIAVTLHHVTTSAADFGWTSRRVRFDVGERVAHLRLPVRRDGTDEPGEDVDLVLDRGRGLAADTTPPPRLRVVDIDDPPGVEIEDGSATASNVIDVPGAVTVRLSEPSGWDVRVLLRTRRETARRGVDYRPATSWVTVPAGSTVASWPVALPPGPVGERSKVVGVEVLDVRHAGLTGDAEAWLTIHGARTRIKPRMLPPGTDWT
jgi:peptidoglycan/xylan/chitin deacetylase (PgdA/CDA1 family)